MLADVCNSQVELTEPEAEWEVVNAWFVRQKQMNVKVTQTAP